MKQKLTWDLSDIYVSPEDPQIALDFKQLEELCNNFEAAYKGHLNEITHDDFFNALEIYEAISILVGKLYAYPHLLKATNMDKPEIVTLERNTLEKISSLTKKKIFFVLEVNQISDEKFAELNVGKVCEVYGSFLNDYRKNKKYDLSEESTKLLCQMSEISSPWIELYETTRNNASYHLDGKDMKETNLTKFLNVEDANLRHEAGQALADEALNNLNLYTLIMNTIAKDKQIRYELLGINRPDGWANIGNDVEDIDVDALVKATEDNYQKISSRYYGLKAKMLGVENFHYFDRSAPYPSMKIKKQSWEEMQNLVLKSFESFSPQFCDTAKNFFDKNWIDVMPKDGKHSGAFASGLPKTLHPYVYLNYNGISSYALTVAHELGHGVHGILSNNVCNMSKHPSRVMSEVSSIFAESLTFKQMMKEEIDVKVKFWMLAGRIENMMNTTIRQIAFHNYEMQLHTERKSGSLSSKRIGEIWLECMQASFGGAMDMSGCENLWVTVPHMFKTPFYVYSYAFSSCMVNSLFKVYEDGILPDFEERYIKMLSAGGTINYKEALANFGIDASAPDFWSKGYDVISELINELEILAEKL